MPTTENVRAIELRLNDVIVLDNSWITGEQSFEFLTVTSLALHGDDVVINDHKVTTSLGNTLPILPRSVIARLAD